MDVAHYTDDFLRRVLVNNPVVAMIGASANPERPSYRIMKYLQGKGFRVIPINPGEAGNTIHGELCYARLQDVPEQIDIVDVFRRSEAAEEIVTDAIAAGAKAVWMQLGVENAAAAEKGRAAGLDIIMNRCPKIECSRLFGERTLGEIHAEMEVERPQ
ncbi:MAG: hypothetical protein CMM50_06570 [Rhodospirillaceae bacterium]|nr:hypothetical protein [Rhodospirillaceae bacterium]